VAVDVDEDRLLRYRIMDLLADHQARTDGTLSRPELSAFSVDGQSLRLIDQSRGIWNPQAMVGTLSVLSSSFGPYADTEISPGVWRYDYRAGSIAGDNTKLRRAYEMGLPIIYLRMLERGVFQPVHPVFVIADNVEERFFTLALEDVRMMRNPVSPTIDERRYAQRIVEQRMHQPEFRSRVLRAYAIRCSVCTLRHAELLDAAHIISDREAEGHPIVSNGLSLCKIHHASYDQNLLGITPDYKVHINADLLAETDGPMLQYGIQAMHGRSLTTPERKQDRPDRDRLAARYERFQSAG
jgi:putative restriction endonuclease